jgi:hypothetical protein
MVMSRKKTAAMGSTAVLVVLAAVLLMHFAGHHGIYIRGAVVAADPDPAKELPLANVEVAVAGRLPESAVRTDNSGYFRIPIPWRDLVRLNLPLELQFRHPGYQSFSLPIEVRREKLYVVQLMPLAQAALARPHVPEVKVSHVVARYSINTTTVVSVGSAVKSLQVVNTGSVPCKGHLPCSPDGKWKAATGSAVLDAGLSNEFHNARASCIAGPCPFTKVDSRYLSADHRFLQVTALDWSDTATFLAEAEVYRPVVSDALRQSYPVMFDRALTFTLPSAAEGVSIQAELDGTLIIFPLGPGLLLSWANCQLVVNKDQTKVYRCELKPGYRFS